MGNFNQEWLKQTVTSVRKWHIFYRFYDHFVSAAPLDVKQLDQIIEQTTPLKHDKTTTVAKVNWGDLSLVLKRYNPRSFGHKIKRCLRRSRAQRCWTMSSVFAGAGLNVAQPVFMVEQRFGFFRKNAYFANQCLQGQELLQTLPTMNESEQHSVVKALRQAMQIMQQNRISHGDLKASNLLWVDKQLFFIDLDAAQQHVSMLSWRRANKRDKRRFLKNWRDQPELLKLFSWLE